MSFQMSIDYYIKDGTFYYSRMSFPKAKGRNGETANKILSTLQTSGEMYTEEVAKEFDIAWTTANYHLKRLKAQGGVTDRIERNDFDQINYHYWRATIEI